MKTSAILALVVMGLIISLPCAAAVSFFKNMTAAYTIKYDGIAIGKSFTTLKILPLHHYKLCIDNKTTLPFLKGSLEECSLGKITPTDIQPMHYDYIYQRERPHKVTHIHIDFDWKTHTATMIMPGTRWHLTFPDHVQDKISYQLLLRRALLNHQQKIAFPIADGGKIKIYPFQVVDTEKLNTAWKTVDTIKLERLPMPEKENVTLWLMKDYDFIVAKARQSKHIINSGTAEIDHVQI